MSMLALLVSAALAAPAAAAPAAPAPAVDPNQRICKTTKDTGSRLGRKRICMTAAEWQLQREETARRAKDVQKQSGGSTN